VEYFRGRRYNRKKTIGHGAGSAGQNEPQNTAEKLAAEYGVSPATVKRAGKTADLDGEEPPPDDGKENPGILPTDTDRPPDNIAPA